MHLGGSLLSDAIFKKILSIGYEFETGDLAKLSLHTDKRTLINSDLSLRLLKQKLERGSINKIDSNYLHVRIPIIKKGMEDVIIEPELTEEEDEETKEFLKLMSEEFPEEYEKQQNEKNAKMMEALQKKENDSYPEYFNENRKSDNPEIIKFQITNDIGDNAFATMVKSHCKDLTAPKNDMFFFQTNKGKLYNLKFSEEIAKTEYCETFSGVEFVVTYYNPTRDNANIIIETFVDSCSRIIDHLGNLKSVRGTLLAQDDQKTHFLPIGLIENERNLYHKPHTNLFYMDTYDNENTVRLQNYGDAEFISQMTFRCKAVDAVGIMKEILRKSPSFTKGSSLIRTMAYDLKCITNVETGVENLFLKYNETADVKIDVNSDEGKNLKTYLVLIYYKIYVFLIKHASIISQKDYLKDHLTFASRHPNIIIYKRIKEILKQKYNITDVQKIRQLLVEPDILQFLYNSSPFEKESEKENEIEYVEPNNEDYNEKGEYKYNVAAFKEVLPEYSDNFGNPLYSLTSYFEYMEEKDMDWLSYAKYDTYSTTFELNNDEVLLENRSFRYAIELYLRNMINFEVTKDSLTIRDMHNIVNKYYGKNIRRLATLSRHPKKNRLTRKLPTTSSKRMSKKVTSPLNNIPSRSPTKKRPIISKKTVML